MATTILCSIGSRAADNVSVNSVSGTDPGPYTVTLSAAVPTTTKVGDTLTDSGARKYLIEGISGSDLTVHKRHFGAGADPATGAGTTQRAYAKPSDWDGAAPADLTTADQVWIGEMWNDATFTETVAISLGATADSTRYMHLRCGPGQSFKDHVNKLTNALRPNQANGVYVEITTHTSEGIYLSPFARVEGIQFYRNQVYSIATGSGTNTVADMGRFTNCIFKSTGGPVEGQGTINPTRCNYINCAVISTATNATGAISATVVGRITNCTFVNTSGASSGKAIDVGFGGGIVVNTATFGWGADNAIGGSSSYNATDRASFGGGTNNQTSLTITDQIQSITAGSEDLRAKSGGAIVGNGVRDQTWTNDLDIVGQARATGTAPSGPTIGCWEVQAAAAGKPRSAMTLLGVG